MSERLAPVIPAPLRAVLARDPAPDESFTILVLSASDGCPHMAMISVGEIVAVGDRTLRLALWPDSTSAASLAENGRVTLAAVLDATAYAVRASVRRRADITTPLAGALACFDATVEEVRADAAPYAVLETGVRFRLKDPGATLPRWLEVRRALEGEGCPGA